MWLQLLERVAPPLVTPEEDSRSLRRDLEVLGLWFDEDGVALE